MQGMSWCRYITFSYSHAVPTTASQMTSCFFPLYSKFHFSKKSLCRKNIITSFLQNCLQSFSSFCKFSHYSACHVMWCDYKERQRIYNMAVESWQQERCRIKSDTFLLLLSLISCFCPQIIIQLPLQSCRTKRFIVSSLVCLLVKAIPFVRDRKRIFSWHARNGIIFRLSRDPFQNVPLRQAKLQNDINTNLERQERWQQLTHDEDDGASFL